MILSHVLLWFATNPGSALQKDWSGGYAGNATAPSSLQQHLMLRVSQAIALLGRAKSQAFHGGRLEELASAGVLFSAHRRDTGKRSRGKRDCKPAVNKDRDGFLGQVRGSNGFQSVFPFQGVVQVSGWSRAAGLLSVCRMSYLYGTTSENRDGGNPKPAYPRFRTSSPRTIVPSWGMLCTLSRNLGEGVDCRAFLDDLRSASNRAAVSVVSEECPPFDFS